MFSVSLCFSLACLTSPFDSLFLSLSLLFFLAFFPPCFFHCFIPCFEIFFVGLCLCLCFMQRTTSNDNNVKVAFINPFNFLGFLFCFVFQITFSYLYFSPNLKALGPTSPNPSLLWRFVFICVGFVFVILHCFLLVLKCFWCIGVCCCFEVVSLVFVSYCLFRLFVLQCFCHV